MMIMREHMVMVMIIGMVMMMMKILKMFLIIIVSHNIRRIDVEVWSVHFPVPKQ